MKRAKIIVIVAIFVSMLAAICVLSFKLYESQKWSGIYFRHMMAAENELDRPWVGYLTVEEKTYEVRVQRGKVEIEPVAESHGTTIPT